MMNKHKNTFLKNILLSSLLLLGSPTLAWASFFSDSEIAPQQRFVASELVLEPGVSTNNFLLTVAGGPASVTLTTRTSAASIDSQYDLAVTAIVAGTLCDDLQLQTATGAAMPLTDFASQPLSHYGNTVLLASLADGAIYQDAETCEFVLTTTAWQTNMSKDSAGYFDKIEQTFVVTAPTPSALRIFAPSAGPESLPVVEMNDIDPDENTGTDPNKGEEQDATEGTTNDEGEQTSNAPDLEAKPDEEPASDPTEQEADQSDITDDGVASQEEQSDPTDQGVDGPQPPATADENQESDPPPAEDSDSEEDDSAVGDQGIAKDEETAT